MQVQVVSRHMSLSEAERSHTEDEALKLAKFFDGVFEVKVTFEREHDLVKAEIVCLVSGGATLVAVDKGRTVDEALELASDIMARQIKKHKARLHDHRLHGAGGGKEAAQGGP